MTDADLTTPLGTVMIEWCGTFSRDNRLIAVTRLVEDERGLTPERYDRDAGVWRYDYGVLEPLITGDVDVERIDAAAAATFVPGDRMGTDPSYRLGPTPDDPGPASVAALMGRIRARTGSVVGPPGWETLRKYDR